MTIDSAKQNKRILSIDGVINFRDLGGYKTIDGRSVKWHQLYRSAQLDRLTDQGVFDMAAMGLKVVVDLRFSDETHKYPTMLAAVPDAEILSWHDESVTQAKTKKGEPSNEILRSWKESLESNDPAQVREAMRVNYPKKLYSHRAIYRKMIQRLVNGQFPLVFHCAAGKDRTGVAAALVLSLLGVNDEQIIEDYLITQQEIQHLLENWMSGGAGHDDPDDFQQCLASYPQELVQPVFDADPSYIHTLLDYVNNQYGSFTQYALEVLDINESDIQRLKSHLLT